MKAILDLLIDSRSLRYIARPIGTMGALLTMALAVTAVTGWPIHGACGVVALLALAVRDMKEDAT